MQQSFSASERRWKCLCGSVHAQAGTKAIGWLGVVCAVLLAVWALSLATTEQGDDWADYMIQYSSSDFDAEAGATAAEQDRFRQQVKSVLVGAMAVSALFNGLIAWCTLHGAYRERRGFLLPYLVVLAISIFFGVLRLFSLACRSYVADQCFLNTLLSLLFSIWFFDVVYTCYRYLAAKEQHERLPTTINGMAHTWVVDSFGYALPPGGPPPYTAAAMQPQAEQEKKAPLA